MRWRELLRLKWDDVDPKEGVIRVGRTLTSDKGRILLGEAKTKKIRRSMHITSTAVQALKFHRKRQLWTSGCARRTSGKTTASSSPRRPGSLINPITSPNDPLKTARTCRTARQHALLRSAAHPRPPAPLPQRPPEDRPEASRAHYHSNNPRRLLLRRTWHGRPHSPRYGRCPRDRRCSRGAWTHKKALLKGRLRIPR